jgi:hypothetical protein
MRGIFRATLPDVRNFRSFKHPAATGRTRLQSGSEVRKMLKN